MIKSILSILGNVIKNKGSKFRSVKEECLTFINKAKDLKGKAPTFKDKNLIKVFSNPWVIANGVVLIVALSMTIVIVFWFKTRTNKINNALTNLAQLQSESVMDKTSLENRKVTVQPFIVREETLKEKKPGTTGVGKGLKMDEDFESLLESSEQSFRRGEYKKALAFYSGLVNDDSYLGDKSFLNLRIGECYFHSGMYNEAIEAFNAVLFAKVGDEENKWHSRYLLAECHLRLGGFDKGRKTLYELMALSGDFPPNMTDLVARTYFRIADSYLEETQAGEAIRD